MNPRRQAQWQLHTSVLLFGFTAILGALIELPSVPLVWWRLLLAVPVFAALLMWQRKGWPRIAWQSWRELSAVGLVLGLHWITFYGSIKLAGASVAVVCLSSATFFTALLDPVLGQRRRHSLREVLQGVAVIAGIALIFALEERYLGIAVGLLSAILSALVGILNKRVIARYDSPTLNFVQLGGLLAVYTLAMPLYAWLQPNEPLVPTRGLDWLWLGLLAWVCTNLAYDLSIRSLRHLSAFEFILAINLEPIYGVVLAIVLLGEGQELTWGFFAGAAIVFAAVFLPALLGPKPQPSDA